MADKLDRANSGVIHPVYMKKHCQLAQNFIIYALNDSRLVFLLIGVIRSSVKLRTLTQRQIPKSYLIFYHIAFN